MHGGGFSGHGGGGFVSHGGGGFANRGGGHVGVGRPVNGMRSGGMRSGFSRGPNHSFNRGFNRGPFRDRGFRGHRRHDFDRFRFRNNCYGYGCGYGYGYGYPYWGYYDPWLSDWSYDDSRFDQDHDRDLALANQMNEQSLEQQRMWREEETDGDQDAYSPRSSNRYSASSDAREPQPELSIPATVLVFRDQHRQEVRNYAIVGQTVWYFEPQRTHKIPLADLDVAATQKANDDRGVTFRVPGPNEGQ